MSIETKTSPMPSKKEVSGIYKPNPEDSLELLYLQKIELLKLRNELLNQIETINCLKSKNSIPCCQGESSFEEVCTQLQLVNIQLLDVKIQIESIADITTNNESLHRVKPRVDLKSIILEWEKRILKQMIKIMRDRLKDVKI